MLSQESLANGPRRSKRELRQLCRDALAGLNLDLPVDAEQLCSRYGAKRGRPVTILAHPLPAGMPSGVWLVGENADFFFYQSNTTRAHRDQIVIHEFGHLIAGHQVLPTPASTGDFGAASGEALSRTCYSDAREWEAEMLATLIGEWADRALASAGRTPEHQGLRGLQKLFGGHAGWL